LTRGSGKRFLLGLIVLIAPVCAFLPNATVVILLAPVIIRVAEALEIDFVAPMILTAIISQFRRATHVGGRSCNFLVGSAMGMSFIEYLNRVALGGLLSLVVLILLFALLTRDIWRVTRTMPTNIVVPPLQQPLLGALALLLLVAMVLLFLFGEALADPNYFRQRSPLLHVQWALADGLRGKVEPVQRVLGDIDWKTLIFIACMFVLVRPLSSWVFANRLR